MIGYLARRVLGLAPLLLGISVMTFGVIHLAPGEPVTAAGELNPKMTSQSRAKMMELYGLDRPLHVQYADWMKRTARLDFGESFKDGRPVIEKIAARVPVTLFINLVSLAIILGLAIPIGVTGAVREGSRVDRVLTACVFAGFAVPTFWLSLLLMSLFGVRLHLLPVSGLTSLDFEAMSLPEKAVDVARHLALPLFVSAFTSLAGLSRYMRTSMLEVVHQDYIKTAWSKGLPASRVIWHHAFRNALMPIITILGLSVPGLLGGSVIFETIFSIPGLGRLFFDAVLSRDYPVIMGMLMMGAVLTLIGNLLADVAYALADPRIRLSGRR